MEGNSDINQMSQTLLPDFPSKEECIYTTHYCEENIFMLAKKIQETTPENLKFFYTVFISNENKHIPLWKQKEGKLDGGPVLWDYHVIMVYQNGKTSLVFDFDTQLKFPTPFSEYSEETFKSDEFINPTFHRFFRVISADCYLKNFSSDRRHMIKDGLWLKPPPEYPVLHNSEENHNLEQYISMRTENSVSSKFGSVFNLDTFIERFSVS